MKRQNVFIFTEDKHAKGRDKVRDYCHYHCTENNIFLFQTSWKDGICKKSELEYDLSCIIGKDDISFSRKYDLTP